MKKISVLIVDNHTIVRQGLRSYLSANRHLQIIGDVGSLEKALEFISDQKPDVILLEYRLPDGDGIVGCLTIKKIHPTGKVIMLTGHTNLDIMTNAYQAGVDAYLLKDTEGDMLIKTIVSTYGKNGYCTGFKRPISATETIHIDFDLSEREVMILNQVSIGKLNKEIGDMLDVSEKTIRNHMSRIFKKINVSNRTEAASFWIRNTKQPTA